MRRARIIALVATLLLVVAQTGRGEFFLVEVQSPHGYRGIGSLTFTPGASILYVADYGSDQISIYWRDQQTAAIEEVVELPGVVNGPLAAAMSPGAEHFYLVGYYDARIAVFERDVWGGLEPIQVLPPQADLDLPQGAALSPDGAHLYVTGHHADSIMVFARDPVAGMLTAIETYRNGEGGIQRLEGPIGIEVSPDGTSVYVSSFRNPALLVFGRDPATGGLIFVEYHTGDLGGALGMRVSPDGRHVYVSGGQITVFARDAATGALTRIGEVPGSIKDLRLTADGSRAYGCGSFGVQFGGKLVGFARNPTTGWLVEDERIIGADSHETPSTCFGLAITADGEHLYVNNTRPVYQGGAVTRYDYDIGVFRHQHAVCSSTPLAQCRGTLRPGASSLKLTRGSTPAASTLKWKWRGAATSLAELRDPVTTASDYALCVYDAGALIVSSLAPGGSLCGEDSLCWTGSGSGFKYRDREARNAGMRSADLKPGADGRARFKVQAEGPRLALPAPAQSLVGPVTVQLQASDGGPPLCWEASFSLPDTNTPDSYRARSD